MKVTPIPCSRLPLKRRRTFRVGAAALVLSAVAGCSGGTSPESGPTIDRGQFIDAYVELRAAALTSDEGQLGDVDREAVLTKIGVTEAELLHFGDAHGEDVEFMSDVWNEVEVRLDGMRREGAPAVEPRTP